MKSCFEGLEIFFYFFIATIGGCVTAIVAALGTVLSYQTIYGNQEGLFEIILALPSALVGFTAGCLWTCKLITKLVNRK
jgi:hypothetical protein